MAENKNISPEEMEEEILENEEINDTAEEETVEEAEEAVAVSYTHLRAHET